jgi:archaellum component FlaF (FlaF/FlaG flagellin family)
MSYNYEPNRIYISSEDRLNPTTSTSSNFYINLENGIRNASQVSLLSCEYPSSFYNILPTDKITFDEVYYDEDNQIIIKRIRFSISGIEEGNYTANTLATAVNAKLTYNSNLLSPMIGLDQDWTVLIPEDVTPYGVVLSDGMTPVDNTNDQIFIKPLFDNTTINTPSRITELYYKITSAQLGNKIAYAFIIEGTKILLSVKLSIDSTFYDSITDSFKINLVNLGYDVGITKNTIIYQGILIPAGVTMAADVSSNTFSNQNILTAAKEEILSAANTNPFVDIVQPSAANYTQTITDNSNIHPLMDVLVCRKYDYNYNKTTEAHLKAQLNVSYNAASKTYSIRPIKNDGFLDADENEVVTETFPFYKNIYSFGGVTKSTGLESYLEIVVSSNKASLNYILGARSSSNTTIKSTNISSNLSIYMPSVPNLIRFPYVYLVCNFVNDSYKSGTLIRSILQKLPFIGEYGSINYFSISANDSSYCVVNREEVKYMQFRIVDNFGNEVDLNGSEISFTLNFVYN